MGQGDQVEQVKQVEQVEQVSHLDFTEPSDDEDDSPDIYLSLTKDGVLEERPRKAGDDNVTVPSIEEVEEVKGVNEVKDTKDAETDKVIDSDDSLSVFPAFVDYKMLNEKFTNEQRNTDSLAVQCARYRKVVLEYVKNAVCFPIMVPLHPVVQVRDKVHRELRMRGFGVHVYDDYYQPRMILDRPDEQEEAKKERNMQAVKALQTRRNQEMEFSAEQEKLRKQRQEKHASLLTSTFNGQTIYTPNRIVDETGKRSEVLYFEDIKKKQGDTGKPPLKQGRLSMMRHFNRY